MLDKTINTMWIVETVDPKIRFESVGKPVKAGTPVLLKHIFTG